MNGSCDADDDEVEHFVMEINYKFIKFLFLYTFNLHKP